VVRFSDAFGDSQLCCLVVCENIIVQKEGRQDDSGCDDHILTSCFIISGKIEEINLTFGDASSAGTLRDGWPKQLLDPTFSLVVVAFFFFADRAKSAIFALVLASTAESVAAVANIWLIGAAFFIEVFFPIRFFFRQLFFYRYGLPAFFLLAIVSKISIAAPSPSIP